MTRTRVRYFEEEDVLHLAIADEPESRTIELSPNITVELNDRNERNRSVAKIAKRLRETQRELEIQVSLPETFRRVEETVVRRQGTMRGFQQ